MRVAGEGVGRRENGQGGRPAMRGGTQGESVTEEGMEEVVEEGKGGEGANQS